MDEDRSDHIIAELRSGGVKVSDLITLYRDDDRIQALAASDSAIPDVRAALIDLGLAGDSLHVRSATGLLLPYPTDDPMIMRWVERTSGRPSSE